MTRVSAPAILPHVAETRAETEVRPQFKRNV
jgi:hypothetical protein